MRNILPLLLVLLSLGAWAQAPTTNPFTSRYPEYANRQHWTDSIDWASPIDVTAHGVTPNDNSDDLAAVQALIDLRSSIGGAVLYFPAGTYNFSDSLLLKSNVILRGPEPTIANATDTNYRPLAKFEFPQYIFDTTANGGLGNPNSSAFKRIEAEKNAVFVGLVNIDVNRASIDIHPHEWRFQPNPKGGGGTYPGGSLVNGVKGTMLPDDWPSNVLIFGVRNNNAAVPDPSVPTATQQPWQRWAWRFGANIDLNVRRNGIVANCRINDDPTDDFNQPNYKYGTSGAANCSAIPADGSGTRFRFTDHYGISVNRAKITRSREVPVAGGGPNGNWGALGVIVAAEPEDEPPMFSVGNLILDNWVFRTMRIAIEGAGTGLQIKGNVIRDLQGKQLWMDVNGTNCQRNASATYENRGIDFSGWNALIENNVVEANTHRVMSVNNGQYGTVDGEGIMMQECCGGTNGNNYTIRGNTISGNNPQGTNPGISMYKIANMSNILVENNTFQTRRVLLLQSRTETGNNLLVRNNNAVNSLSINVNQGGYNVRAENNTAFAGNSTATVSCWIDFVNNTGFGTISYKDAANVTLPGPCVAAPYQLAVSIISPIDTAYYPAGTTTVDYVAKARVINTTQADSVLWYVDGILSAKTPIDMVDTTASFTFAVPDTGFRVYQISARLDDANDRKAYSNNVHTVINTPKPVLVGNRVRVQRGALRVFPNPASETTTVAFPYNSRAISVRVVDALGREVQRATGTGSQINVPLHNLKPGMYMLQADGDGQRYFSRVTVQ